MRRFWFVVLVGFLATGCVQLGPGKGAAPADSDDLFNGKPADVVVRVISAGAGQLMMSMLASTETHTVVIGTPIYNESGHQFTTKYTILEVPSDDQLLEQGFDDVPAAPGHQFTAIRIEDDRLIEFGRASGVDVPFGVTTEVDVPMIELGFELEIPEAIPGGSKVVDVVSITPTNPDAGVAMLYGHVLLGLNEWDANGASGLWAANKRGEAWITDLAATSREFEDIFFAEVQHEKPLYYQVELCIGPEFLPFSLRDKVQCSFIPDVSEGESLPKVLLVPAE